MRKRPAWVMLLLLGMLLFLPLQVFANSPPPQDWYDITFYNLPEGTAYVDLLVYLPESDPYYTDLEEANFPKGFSVNAEIVAYCVDDFRSYTFHYQETKSAIGVEGTDCVCFFWDRSHNGNNIKYKHMDDVGARGEIRLAMLDKEGNILHVSPTFQLETRKFLGYLKGDFTYNGADDTLEIEEDTAAISYFLYAFLAWIGLLLTCLIEWLVAVIMGLQNKRAVVLVNQVSQILMHILYIVLYSVIFWRYTVALILLELLVYAGEFICYRFWLMRDLATKKCLLFAVIANTASLVLGMLMLRILGILH